MHQTRKEEVRKGSALTRVQFSTLHALRGFAAFWVVLFHARKFGALYGSALAADSLFTRVFFDYGRGGVAIFFVLSGFVISHSLWGTKVSGPFVGRFMLRRSIRLDPPYWASIALALVVAIMQAMRHGETLALSPAVVGAHVLYLQELLRLPEIQVVYWTLTYEIQFYLVYALMLWWIDRASSLVHLWVASLPALLLLIAAFYGAAQTSEWVLHGLFLNYWYAFVAGVLAYAGGHRQDNRWLVLCVLLSITMLFSAPYTAEVFNTPAALTAIALAVLGRFGKLSSLRAAPFKSLGTISYSLYLVHIPAIIVAMSVTTRFFGFGPTAAIATFTFAIAAAVLLASAFWWAIERPSHAFARRVAQTKLARSAP